MQTDVLISFIIPAYNAADTIEKAVQSLTDVPRTEVLIVENGSTDETKQVLERLKKKYSNIRQRCVQCKKSGNSECNGRVVSIC